MPPAAACLSFKRRKHDGGGSNLPDVHSGKPGIA